MDNILFVPSVAESEWVRDVLPGISPAELPVAGKRFVDYAFERAQKLDVRFTEVLDGHFSNELADDFSDLTRTGYPVFYLDAQRRGQTLNGLDDLDLIHTLLTQPVMDGLWVVWGLCLTSHLTPAFHLRPVPAADCARTPTGIYRRESGHWMQALPHGMVVKNVEGWYRLNLAVLHNKGSFTLPGYTSEAEVHLGRNVVLEHGTEVKPPALLQDNTWCARNVTLDKDVIIGQGSYVGEGAYLSRTIVCDNTYVGERLDLRNKIVAGRRIIDAETGAWADMDEPGMARGIGSNRTGWWRKVLDFLYGKSRGKR